MTISLSQMAIGNMWESYDAPEFVCTGLRELSGALMAIRPDAQAHGLFGGEAGYGQHYDCDTFAMHPYYWGECECGFEEAAAEWADSNPHEPHCYQTHYAALDAYGPAERQARAADLCRRIGLTYPDWSAVHCTCSRDGAWDKWAESNQHAATCGIVVPNFLHKPSGLAVHWYKYIGRGTTMSREIAAAEWAAILADCLGALTRPMLVESVEVRDGDG